MVVVKNVNSTLHKVNIVHDPMLFEYYQDPNMQKQIVLQHKHILCHDKVHMKLHMRCVLLITSLALVMS
jgi:hypothetical protein